MSDILKIEINLNSKKELIHNWGNIVKKFPFLVFVLKTKVYIIEYYLEQTEKIKRPRYKPISIYYDSADEKFYEDKWAPTIGTVLKQKINQDKIYFCNNIGLTDILKILDIQAKWIIYKLMKKD